MKRTIVQYLVSARVDYSAITAGLEAELQAVLRTYEGRPPTDATLVSIEQTVLAVIAARAKRATLVTVTVTRPNAPNTEQK